MFTRSRLVAAFAFVAASWAGAQVGSAPAWVAGGEVRYEARDAWATWSGHAPLVAIDLRLDPDDLGTLAVEARVEPAAFDSGNPLRDRRARSTVFSVDRHPLAILVGRAAPEARGARLAPGESRVLPLDTELTLHGVTLPYRIDLRLTRPRAGDTGPWRAETVFAVSLEAHGMRRPALWGLVTDDEVRLSVQATGNPAPTPTPTTR